MEYEVFAAAARSKLSVSRPPSGSPPQDGWVIFIPASEKKGARWDEALGSLDAATRKSLGEYLTRLEFKPKEEEVACFDKDASLRVVVAVLPKNRDTFFLLEVARKALEP